MKKLYILFALFAAVFAGCKKYDYDKTAKGEGLGILRLTSPVSGTNLTLNLATPATAIDFTWTAAAPGVATVPTYSFVATLKTGNIDTPQIVIPSNGGGKETKLTITYQQLDDALQAKGIGANTSTDLIWSVVADNGFVKVRSSDVFSIKITRSGDGITPFTIYGPLSSTNIIEIDPGSTANLVVFKW
ncbi:MAG TPA: SusE domain-containing protein, partial [Ferruginibacter sp.]|nr:SusE domain-containing protein [Ferruginibacter sp.]